MLIARRWCATTGRMTTTRGESSAMDPVWQQSYPPSVPKTIDPDAYASLVEILEQSVSRFRDQPAFVTPAPRAAVLGKFFPAGERP